jgi:hypothetical protein
MSTLIYVGVICLVLAFELSVWAVLDSMGVFQ